MKGKRLKRRYQIAYPSWPRRYSTEMPSLEDIGKWSKEQIGEEVAAIGKAFDRRNFSAVALCGEDRAAFEGLSILVNDASTALAGIAADMGTGQTQMLA